MLNNDILPTQSQFSEIEARIGKSFEELSDIVRWTGLTDQLKIRSMLQREYRMGFEEAKLFVHMLFASTSEKAGKQ